MAQYRISWRSYSHGLLVTSGSYTSSSPRDGTEHDPNDYGKYTTYSSTLISSDPEPTPKPDEPKPGGSSGYTGGSSGGYTPPKPTNKPPKISGEDSDLGGKNKAFRVPYVITDPDSAEVRVDISIDDKVIETIQNVQKNTTLYFDVTTEMLQSYEMEKTKNLIITATDSKNAKAYRNYTFRRTNAPPKIVVTTSLSKEELEKVEKPFTVTYVATDEENDQLSGQVLIDGAGADLKPITNGERVDFEITHEMVTRLAPGQHRITVRVKDDKGQSSSEQILFTRVAPRIVVSLDPHVLTTLLAKKIQVLLTKIDGGPNVTTKVEATNNANDAKPVWEDITAIVKSGGIYDFVNQAAEKDAAINIRIIIASNGEPKETQLLGFSGGFE